MKTTQPRAKVGGEAGVNGEFYEGGKFLPTTQRTKGKPVAKRPAGKQQYEPYQWEVPPSEMAFAIFGKLAGTTAGVVSSSGEPLRMEVYARGVAYYGDDFRGHKIADLVAAFNAGERWATGNV